MTLILTVNGPKSIWLLADRRLSYKGRMLRDDARKVMFLETTDGVSILGYAGLGATALGTEPSDWMSRVLRGRKLPLEQSLGVLADAMKKQIPRHLIRINMPGGPAHSVEIPASLENKVRLYTIDLAFAPDRKSYNFRYTRHVTHTATSHTNRPPKFSIGGSGVTYLERDTQWKRELTHLIKAYDRNKVKPYVVADYLAKLNYAVSLETKDKSVGPNCIIAWRNRRKEGAYKGGGAHCSYTGIIRDSNTPSLPTIMNGMDIVAITGAMIPIFSEHSKATQAGEPPKELDKDTLNEALARLPDKPDKNLK
jgi:hypothetical protein